ncbi:hypothetical protein U9M48_018657 [Paspalum notatum var. saurae]|uniref:Protein CHUP1, chloroplastic n=1 Tax=Paspalum notatum var. saurae TaxID=547442 RepID=A0AAQ3T9U9_PASNO
MGPPSPQQQQGLCFSAPWPWGADGNWMEASLDGGGGARGPGLRFLLKLDPGQPALDRTLLGFSLSALFTRLLGRGRGAPAAAIAGDGGESGSAAAALAAAVSLSLAAAMYASDRRPPPRARRPPLPAPSSAARPRALPAPPQDGLRILSSSNDESLDNVIHAASIGAGDDGPDIVARVVMEAAAPAVSQTAEDETEPDRSEQQQQEEEELQEHERLRELWLSLVEREQRLELRLQELEDLRRAQDAAVRELEGRVAAAATEERLLQLKLSALQEENGRLRAQADELGVARAELARAKEKLRAVKARVQVEEEAAAALRDTVAELERGRDESRRALAAEVAELRKANAALEEENLELALRLQDAEQAAAGASVNLILQVAYQIRLPHPGFVIENRNDKVMEDMAEETKHLRESNEMLTRQIEQLRNDHCAHVEELVYLKWVNACLRHELLRDPTTTTGEEQQDHHHAGDGDGAAGARGLTALELSKSMSFRSSERAKQLMLRYGHPGLDGFGSPALFSPLHESSVDGDGDERSPARRNYESERSPYYARTPEKTPATTTSASAAAAAAPGNKKAGQRKLKFLGNIRKMLPGGKRSHNHSAHGHGHAGGDGRKAPAAAPSDEYLEKAMRWLSTHDVLDGDHSYDSTPLYSSCERTPVSSVTTNTTADMDSRARGGGGHSEHGGEAARREAGPGPVLARSKSDAGGSYGREVSRYHALRPDHPAAGEVEPDGFRAPEKREGRRRSEGLRSPVVT